MARKYVNPNRPGYRPGPAQATEKLLLEARARADAAADRLRAAEHADPSRPGWEAEYETAAAAVPRTTRRVEALERLLAVQVERAGKREEALKAAAADLKAMPTALAASRDRVSAAAAEQLRALAGLEAAIGAHNDLLAGYRAKLAERGLRIRDDLLDQGYEHAEGCDDSAGLRAGGINWIPIPAGAVAAHGLRLVFAGAGLRHPLREAGKYAFRPHEVESRADGLQLPTLAGTGVAGVEVPRPALPERPSIRDGLIPPVLEQQGGYHPGTPARRNGVLR